jgi:hypothetical protein
MRVKYSAKWAIIIDKIATAYESSSMYTTLRLPPFLVAKIFRHFSRDSKENQRESVYCIDVMLVYQHSLTRRRAIRLGKIEAGNERLGNFVRI